MNPHKKMLSIYLSQTQGLRSSLSKNFVATLSIEIQAQGGTNFVTIAAPDTRCLVFELNSKKLLF